MIKYNLLTLLFLFQTLFLFGQSNLAGSYGLDPEVQKFLELIHAYQGPPIHELPLNIGRQAMEDMQKEEIEEYQNDVVFEKKLIEFSGKKVNIVIVKPRRFKNKKLPVLVYFHGGGWVYNSFDTHKRLMSDIVIKSKIAVVFVEFSRAPEVRYPTANNQGYTVLQWILSRGAKNSLDKKNIIIGGDSAGGNMATAIAMTANKHKLLKLKGLVLLYPVTNDNLNTQSYEQFSKGHYLSRETMKWFWDVYAPNKEQRSLGTVAPLKSSLEELKGLPSTLLITAEYDVLRDEGESFAKKLRKAGVPVISTRYGGTIHDFIVLNPLKETNASVAATAQICWFLKEKFKIK